MRLASSARWGEPMVRRTGDAHLSSSRGLGTDSVMYKSLAGAAVTSLTAFGHIIDTPIAVCLDTTPNIPSPLCHASAQLYFDQFLSEGPFQSSVDQERTKLCGSSLQPLRGSASSVGLGVLLRRCATVASWIGCPRSLLTSCCVHVWQDLTVLAATFEPAHVQGRYPGLRLAL